MDAKAETSDHGDSHYSKKSRLDKNGSPGTTQKGKFKSPSRLRSKRSWPNVNGRTENASEKGSLTYILDSGAYTVKAGLSTSKDPMLIPNCIMKVKSEKKRNYIGSQIDECRDFSGLYYLLPCSHGFIVKWDIQKGVWDYIFSKPICPINENPVLMTQPLFNFKSIQDCVDEIFFEEYNVKSLFKANPTDLSRYQYVEAVLGQDEECLVIDSGFSYTHVVPYINGEKFLSGVKRLDIGGKFLTNILKDTVSYRMYDVRDETYVINQVKEDTFFVSEDYNRDLRISKNSPPSNTIARNYVLPDFNNIKRGYVQNGMRNENLENCQILSINNERFTIPELLFKPNDQHVRGLGIAEAVAKAIDLAPVKHRKALARNIVVTGGNVNIPGFAERVKSEVKRLLPDNYEVNVYKPENPMTFAWHGGQTLSQAAHFSSLLVTKQEYEEHGSSAIQERFNSFTKAEEIVSHETEPETVSYIEHVKKHKVFEKDQVQSKLSDVKSVAHSSEQSSVNLCENVDEEVVVSRKVHEEESEGVNKCSLFEFDLLHGFEPYEFKYV